LISTFNREVLTVASARIADAPASVTA